MKNKNLLEKSRVAKDRDNLFVNEMQINLNIEHK